MGGLTPRLIAIVGPTATGKSALGIALARRFDGEVVGCDSTAVYRGFDIGTDKVPPVEQQGISHHMVDVVDPTEEYSAARYARDNQRRIVCGPTGSDREALAAEHQRAHKLAGVPPGSEVQLTGICLVQTDALGVPESFRIQLRSPEDLVVIRKASWFTLNRAMTTV